MPLAELLGVLRFGPIGMLLNKRLNERLLLFRDSRRITPSVRFWRNRLRLAEGLLEPGYRGFSNIEKLGKLLGR